MKVKTIKSVLAKKFSQWTESIKDETVRNLVSKNTIITGGAIVSLLQNEQPKDFDLYFRDKETTKAVAQYYVDQWNKNHGAIENHIGNKESLFVLDGEDVQAWKNGLKGITSFAPNYEQDIQYNGGNNTVSHMITNTEEDRIKVIYPSDGVISKTKMVNVLDDLSEIDETILEDDSKEDNEKYRPVFITTNAITLSNKIQIIIRFYGEPEQIHSNYDFIHCCCYWDSCSKELVTPNESLLAIINKDLVYRGSKYPVCSIIRAKKFVNRGWKINAGQFVKMAFQVSRLNLQDIDILEDQLVGVDTVYFLQVVNALRKMRENDPNFSFDSTYLASIIDRIF